MLTFNTNENEYIYDDYTGMVFPLPDLVKEIIPLSGLSKDEVILKLERKFPNREKDIAHSYELVKKWHKIGAFSQYNPIESMREPTVEELREYVLRKGLRGFTLNVTQNCNLRCRYCAYSGEYDYFRVHSPKRMNFETAKKGIDVYFSLIDEGRKYNPNRKPSVGFYGGEPLLEFPLIKSCVEYIKNSYGDHIAYTITTNGTLLDEKKIDYLLKNDFSLIISLDGPKDEHDRNRAYPSGRGSFDDVMGNIETLKKFAESGKVQNVYTISVHDWRTDLFKVQDFFNEDPFIIPMLATGVNPLFGCHYYERFTEKDLDKFSRQLDEIRKKYLEEAKSHHHNMEKLAYFDLIVGQPVNQLLFLRFVLYKPYPFLPCTGACVPGRKLFVECDGTIHICERVNDKFPIGNVEKGLDFNKVREVMIKYQGILKNCCDCPIKRVCSECYCGFETDSFKWDEKRCKSRIEDVKGALSYGYAIGESNPSFFDQFTENYYRTLKEVLKELE